MDLSPVFGPGGPISPPLGLVGPARGGPGDPGFRARGPDLVPRARAPLGARANLGRDDSTDEAAYPAQLG